MLGLRKTSEEGIIHIVGGRSIINDVLLARVFSDDRNFRKKDDPDVKILRNLEKEYQNLCDESRTYQRRLLKWEEIENAIPDLPDFIAALETLENPEMHFIDGNGRLVFTDGSEQPPLSTFFRNRTHLENEVARISYRSFNGDISIITGPDVAVFREFRPINILTERSFCDPDTYSRLNKGQYEVNAETWVADNKEDDPVYSHVAGWDEESGDVYFNKVECFSRGFSLGARRMLKVALNL